MSEALALQGATETALELPGDMSYEEWEETGRTLGKIDRACRWWLGDWLNFGEARYGEKYAQAVEETGLEYSTLTNIAFTAEHVDRSRRREKLSFSHHSEVASQPPAKQRVLLNEAESGEWSVAKLRKELKGADRDVGAEETEVCPKCGRPLDPQPEERDSGRNGGSAQATAQGRVEDKAGAG